MVHYETQGYFFVNHSSHNFSKKSGIEVLSKIWLIMALEFLMVERVES